MRDGNAQTKTKTKHNEISLKFIDSFVIIIKKKEANKKTNI